MINMILIFMKCIDIHESTSEMKDKDYNGKTSPSFFNCGHTSIFLFKMNP